MRRSSISIVIVLVAASACDRSNTPAKQDRTDSVATIRDDSIARARQDSINRAQPGYIIDSLLPVEEELRRFRAAIGGSSVTSLEHASPSRDSLVRRFALAVERSDTAALVQMAISPREYADLVYPESPYTRPPYRQAPGFAWTMIQLPSGTGLRRLLERHGGRPLRVTGVTCDPKPEHQGANTLWARCEAHVINESGGESRLRLFGSIIERDGLFKFMSYANQY